MQASYFNNSRPEVARFLPERYSKVLEVGCGEGCFRANLADGCEYWGIEPDEAAAGVASSRLDKVLRGDFDSLYASLPDNYFDLLVCNDVIEHLPDPAGFLLRVTAKMKPGSHIVGSVPNVRQIDNLIELLVFKDWKYRDSGVLDRTHLRFFTQKSLKRVLLQSHLIAVEIEGINSSVSFGSVKGVLKAILTMILGPDTKFLQFGFRVRTR